MNSVDSIDSHVRDVSISRLQREDFNLNVTISKRKHDDSVLSKLYDIKKYLNSADFSFNSEYEKLIPQDTPPYLDNGGRYVERIARALHYFKQCALIGPSGTGKTHIVYLVAELAKLPLLEINCGLQTSVFDLFGRYIGLGKENWIDGQIITWCRHGGILYLDEANMMKQDVATRLNPILDTRGHIVLNEKDNEMIPRHKDAYLIISMNPFSAEFAGTKPLNAAFRRRMSVWLNFDYMSVGQRIDEKEVMLVMKKTEISKQIAENIVKVGSELRKQYKTGDFPYAPSIGDLVNWAYLIADGSSIKESSEETIIAMTSDDVDVQNSVRKVVNAVFGQLK